MRGKVYGKGSVQWEWENHPWGYLEGSPVTQRTGYVYRNPKDPRTARTRIRDYRIAHSAPAHPYEQTFLVACKLLSRFTVTSNPSVDKKKETLMESDYADAYQGHRRIRWWTLGVVQQRAVCLWEFTKSGGWHETGDTSRDAFLLSYLF